MTPGGTQTGGRAEGSALVAASRVLRERWWIILLCLVIGAAVSAALAATATKQYEASSRLLLRQAQLADVAEIGTGRAVDPEREAATNLKLVTSRAVADRVRRQLKTQEDADGLLAITEATAEPNTNLVDITVTDPDPEVAARIATAFAEQYVTYRRDALRAAIVEGEKLLQRRIDELPAEATGQREQLEQALRNVTTSEALQTGDAEVVDRATVPGTPASPRPKRDAALGAIIGLVAGLALVFLLDIFDRRVRTVEDFEEMYGIRALTSIPTQNRSPSTPRDRQAALEPFRILRNGLGFLSIQSEIRTVLVTSAIPGEGKSTVAAGLARAIALSGQRVVLVEADLRRPTFHEQFDLGGDRRGLTSALVGGVPVRELLRPVLPGLRTLTVLPSGPVPPNSAELLRSPEMGRLLTELGEEAEIVILDAPPLLPVADAQVLLDHPQVDACLVVARAYLTTREEVRRSRAVLDRHRLDNLGLVVNGLRRLDGDYYYYGNDETEAGPTRLASPS